MSTLTLSIEEFYKMGETAPTVRPWFPAKIFSENEHTGGQHLRIGTADQAFDLLRLLLIDMPEPFLLLYVLIVPRGQAQPGRYQSSEPITRDQLDAFLQRFRLFLEKDGRHNLWIKSGSGPELLVWDRHELVNAYGFGQKTIASLKQAGWTQVDAAAVVPPDPHSHHYHAIFDDDERAVLTCMEWQYSPLREQDF